MDEIEDLNMKKKKDWFTKLFGSSEDFEKMAKEIDVLSGCFESEISRSIVINDICIDRVMRFGNPFHGKSVRLEISNKPFTREEE